MLYPFTEIANFKQRRIRAVNERSCLSYIHSPARGTGIPIRRGSGLFISLLGVWRCLREDKLNIVPRFFFYLNLSIFANPGTREAACLNLLFYEKVFTFACVCNQYIHMLCLAVPSGRFCTENVRRTSIR